MRYILVAGGCGYIGAHVVHQLMDAGYKVIICDNLVNSTGSVLEKFRKNFHPDLQPIFIKVDVCNRVEMEQRVFKKYDIKAVIHLAGHKAVGESVAKPLKYYRNNLCATMTLLELMEKYGCKQFIFSSSATIYGDLSQEHLKKNGGILEGDSIAGNSMSSTNPYGKTKGIIENMLLDLVNSGSKDLPWRVIILRYFNPVGGIYPEECDIARNLLPCIMNVIEKPKEYPYLKVYGDDYSTRDGTGIRDYINVVDLAEGHVKALEKLGTEEGKGIDVYNLGTGTGITVFEMIKIVEKKFGTKVPYKVVSRREGDIPICYANVDKAKKELGWEASDNLL